MVDYDEINRELVGLDKEAAIALLTDLMEDVWCDDYEDRVVAANPQLIDIGTFRVIFDLASVGCDQPGIQDDRVIVIFGRSRPPPAARDAGRMRGYLGRTCEAYGDGYDKGHFIAHSLGGGVLDSVNWFRQERRLNRGWSSEGRVYRRMERYCAAHPGTFVFSRPIYDTLTDRPDVIEFGMLRGGKLDVCQFRNRPGAE